MGRDRDRGPGPELEVLHSSVSESHSRPIDMPERYTDRRQRREAPSTTSLGSVPAAKNGRPRSVDSSAMTAGLSSFSSRERWDPLSRAHYNTASVHAPTVCNSRHPRRYENSIARCSPVSVDLARASPNDSLFSFGALLSAGLLVCHLLTSTHASQHKSTCSRIPPL